jgi:hypothetical protein
MSSLNLGESKKNVALCLVEGRGFFMPEKGAGIG